MLLAMGERLQLGLMPLKRDYDSLHRRATGARSPGERLALGVSWNRMAGRLAAAGKEARDRA